MIYTVRGVKDFSADQTFGCGQCFRWRGQEDGSYIGTAMGRTVRVSFSDGALAIENCDEKDFNIIWKDYFDLGRDYGALKAELSSCGGIMKTAAEYGGGIRILRQDFWETVVSFIISQNSNIPRIRKCIEALCERYGGESGEYGGRPCRGVPGPEVLAPLRAEDLAECRLGYRADYLIKTSRRMLDLGGPGQVAKSLSGSEDPSGQLRQFRGIGPKVADCITLFGLHRLDAFPVDVWMKRVMHRFFGIDEKDVSSMKAYAAGHFGRCGGLAQQYLFYYIRSLEKNGRDDLPG